MQSAYEPRPDDVERKLSALFPDDGERARARGLLDAYGADDRHHDVERVRLAALYLAGGSLGQLEAEIEQANVDYRDVISGAEYRSFLELPAGVRPESDEYQAAIDADMSRYRKWVES